MLIGAWFVFSAYGDALKLLKYSSWRSDAVSLTSYDFRPNPAKGKGYGSWHYELTYDVDGKQYTTRGIYSVTFVDRYRWYPNARQLRNLKNASLPIDVSAFINPDNPSEAVLDKGLLGRDIIYQSTTGIWLVVIFWTAFSASVFVWLRKKRLHLKRTTVSSLTHTARAYCLNGYFSISWLLIGSLAVIGAFPSMIALANVLRSGSILYALIASLSICGALFLFGIGVLKVWRAWSLRAIGLKYELKCSNSGDELKVEIAIPKHVSQVGRPILFTASFVKYGRFADRGIDQYFRKLLQCDLHQALLVQSGITASEYLYSLEFAIPERLPSRISEYSGVLAEIHVETPNGLIRGIFELDFPRVDSDRNENATSSQRKTELASNALASG